MSHARVLRAVGQPFFSAWPLWKPLFDHSSRPLFTRERALPDACARALAMGACEFALVPSSSYISQRAWDMIPEVCVACEGPVESVVLAASTPLERIKTIYVDASSRSSVYLLQVLMQTRRLSPRYVTVPHGRGLERPRGREAALILGDEAFTARARVPYVYDLGAMWFEDTGLPFVFAFWAARPGLMLFAPRHVEQLIGAPARARAHLADYARRFHDQRARQDPASALPAATYRRHLAEVMRYEFSSRARAGLRLFLRRVRALERERAPRPERDRALSPASGIENLAW